MRKWTWLVAVLMPGSSGTVGPRPAAAQTSPMPVALSGTAAPVGGDYGGFSTPVLNGSGQVAFLGGLTGGSSTQGISVGAPGAVQAAALLNTAAPAGGTYSFFFDTVVNRSGQVAFLASLTGGSSSQGIFVGVPGSVQAAALQGNAAPGGGTYLGNFEIPVANGSGQVAFFATLAGGSSTQGVFVGVPGAVQAAARQGDAAPAGGNYSDFTSLTPSLNGSGQVAFRSTLTGGSSTQGIFVGAAGAVQAAALQNTPAPAGGNYSGVGSSRR